MGSEVACTGSCANFNIAGQCYVTDHNCAAANCDIIEFFNQVFNAFLQTPAMADSYYDKVTAAGANTKAGVVSKLSSSGTDCQAILAALQSGYNLPTTPPTGVYGATPATGGGPPSTPTPTPTTKGEPDGDQGDESEMIVLGVVCVLALLVVVAIVVVMMKKNRVCVPAQSQPTPRTEMSNMS